MSETYYDLCIIGGGINGVGVARDAVGRGLSVILVEAGDLGGMTSSASSKMLHGGLRYLEQFEFGLVREALHERETIMKIAPHIAKPMDFVLPHTPEQRPAWMISLGLFFYDFLAGSKLLKASRKLDLRAEAYGKPIKEQFGAAFCYTDGQVDDARLVVLNAVDAAEKGAEILTYTAVTGLKEGEPGWIVQIEDRFSGDVREIQAANVVNAAGPASDKIFEMIEGYEAPQDDLPDEGENPPQRKPAKEVKPPPALRLVKGSHIIIKKLYEGDHGYVLQNDDKRVVFMWPFEGDYTLIGTTEVEYEGHPGDAEASDEEIMYLCEVANLYSKRTVKRSDVVAQFSGVRPLVRNDDKSARTASRRHAFHEYVAGNGARLITIYGGKLTTYRLIAQELLDRLTEVRNGWSEGKPLPGGAFKQVNFELFLQEKLYQYSTLKRSYVRRLARQYGTKMDEILQNAKRMDDLGVHFGADLYENEVKYLIRCEFARTPRDVLWHRTKLDLRVNEDVRRALDEAMPVMIEQFMKEKGAI